MRLSMNATPVMRLPRVDFVQQVCVVPLDGSGRMERLWAVNLSLGGMCLRSPQPPVPGTRVSVSLDSPQQLLPLAEAEVVWQSMSATLGEQHGGFGLRFTDLKAKALIHTLVEHGGTTTPAVSVSRVEVHAFTPRALPAEPRTQEHRDDDEKTPAIR